MPQRMVGTITYHIPVNGDTLEAIRETLDKADQLKALIPSLASKIEGVHIVEVASNFRQIKGPNKNKKSQAA